MRTAKTVSITLPPELLVKAQETAQREHRTISELFREALRRYITDRPSVDPAAWRDLLEYGRAKGRELGISTEADVERMSNEYRASKRG